jgi:hypothetical protein
VARLVRSRFFLDFELKLHFRLIDANAEAVLLLRSDDPGRNALAATGYRLVVFRDDPLIKGCGPTSGVD